jgi:hypothetical protein
MHYRSGKEAKLGDIVRGRGYNIAHDIQGVVVGLTPGANSCNIVVAYAMPVNPERASGHVMLYPNHDVGPGAAMLGLEFGQTDAFDVVEDGLTDTERTMAAVNLVLSHFVGETGCSEGAFEVLARLVKELQGWRSGELSHPKVRVK